MKENKIDGIVYKCDTIDAFRNTMIEEIGGDCSILAIPNDLSKLVMIPSVEINEEDNIDFSDETTLGYMYFLCLTAVLANPKYREKLDIILNEYSNEIINNKVDN